MSISSTLAKEFAKTIKQNEKETPVINLYGNIVVDGNRKYVRIDGSASLTPITEATEALAGDRVLVSIENNKAVVIGNFSYPASARTANDALNAAGGAANMASSAQSMAMQAQNTANNATSAANDAQNLANDAQILADDTSRSLSEMDWNEVFKSTELQGVIDGVIQSIAPIQDLLGGINKEYFSNLDTKLGHIYIGLDHNNNPTMEFGKEDSDSRVVITNEAIIFKKGSNVATYIDDDGLKTDNITVSDEVRLGKWSLVTHGEGNIGLIWRG